MQTIVCNNLQLYCTNCSMDKFSKFVSSLNPFSTSENGFLDIWLKDYYNQRDGDKQKLDKYFKINTVLTVLLAIRTAIALILRDYNIKGNRISILLGSWSTLLGGPPHYFELISLLWMAQTFFCYFTITNRRKDEFLWIELFGALYGHIEPKPIGIDDKLLKRYFYI